MRSSQKKKYRHVWAASYKWRKPEIGELRRGVSSFSLRKMLSKHINAHLNHGIITRPSSNIYEFDKLEIKNVASRINSDDAIV